jgi:hypothetical protein
VRARLGAYLSGTPCAAPLSGKPVSLIFVSKVMSLSGWGSFNDTTLSELAPSVISESKALSISWWSLLCFSSLREAS